MGKRLSEKNPFLRDPEKKKRLMVSAITSSQRQEGIEISDARAQEVYKIVFQEPRIAFFRLVQGGDLREEQFVTSLTDGRAGLRFDVSRRDLLAADGAPLSYWLPPEVMQLFRGMPGFYPSIAEARQGVIAGEDAPYLRFVWEVQPNIESKPWKPLHKGGAFSRFYFSADLVIDWSERAQGRFHRLRDTSLYFRPGLTWPRAGAVLSFRLMPAGCVFSDKGPAILAKKDEDLAFLLGVLNSSVVLYLAKARTSREEMGGRWEIGVIQKLPIPRCAGEAKRHIARLAKSIHDAKLDWDQGNEVSTRFTEPWLIAEARVNPERSLAAALEAVLGREATADREIQTAYIELDSIVFDAYALSRETRETVLWGLGSLPPELIWPQMAGKSTEQKRIEHVWRLLSFCTKRVVDSHHDGIIPLVKCSNDPTLEGHVLAELGKIVGTDRLHEFEGEIASELRTRVPGYKRADSIGDWLANVYFEQHVRLYKSRPVYWQLASSQQPDPAFGAIVHYHRFGKDALRKLRGSYVRGCLERFERDLGYARRENRTDDSVELQQKIDEVRAFDKKLQELEEGKFPIRVPWKEEAQQPKGWDPDIDDGVKVNILPLQNAGLLRIPKVVSAKSEEDE
jgi:hypothetical protein